MTDTVERLSAALADRYVFDRELGKGGMATVYLAQDVRHGRKVAVKVVLPELTAVLGAERFLSEIHVTAALQHPNILPLFDSGQIEGQLFYVMPYVEGESLRGKLDRERQLPIDEALGIAEEVASALDYAHRHGIVHRDIKPENILLHDGHALVADFGIALAVTSAGGGRLTQTGLSLGTPQYMSPEQATGEREIDARSDVYSLAAVVYEMFAGEPPHTGNTMQAVIARMLTERPRNVRTVRPSVPDYVAGTLDKALEKIPADRWHSAQQFADALAGKLAVPSRADTQTRAAAAERGSIHGHRFRDRIRDPLTLGLAAIAIAAIAFGIRGYITGRSQPAAPTVRFPLTLPGAIRLASSTQMMLAMSPDGHSSAFLGHDANGAQKIFIRPLNDSRIRELTSSGAANSIFFSPDGKWFGYVAGEDLKKISFDGSTVLPLSRIDGIFGGGSWSSNGEIVVSMGLGVLYAVPENGGTPRKVCKTEEKSDLKFQFEPLVLSDGKTVLYAAGLASNLSSERLAVASLASGACTVLDVPAIQALGVLDGLVFYVTTSGAVMAAPFDEAKQRVIGNPVPVLADVDVNQVTGAAQASMSLDGSLLYLSAAPPVQIVSADLHGVTQPLVQDERPYSYPRLSPDGRRLAVAVAAPGQRDIWVLDLSSGTTTRLTADGSMNERPEWSPDGKRVLYRTSRGKRSMLWWRAADLSDAEAPLLVSPTEDYYEGVITPDGLGVVYQVDTVGADVFYSRLSGPPMKQPVANTQFVEVMARVSPDGHWVAYVTNESGGNEVVVQSFPVRGPRVPVSTHGGSEPVWSRDGQRIFYRDNQNFLVANVQTNPTFSVKSREVLFADNFVPASLPHANYDVTPDGNHLILLKATDQAQATIVYNWIAEVRARMRGQGKD